MTRKAPLSTAATNLADHAAVRAWGELGGSTPETVDFLRAATRSKPALYRLAFAEPGRSAVFAKSFHAAGLAVERHVYEVILPRLPVTSARFHGACAGQGDATWLFVEDVGDLCLSPRNPEHRVLAARWLGLMHRSAASMAPPDGLPPAGADRYLVYLRSARETIRGSMGNRALSDQDRTALSAVLAQGDALEARWPRLERACEGFPVTLVHADFQPKNLRIRLTDEGPVLYPIDWEMAGWGVPAADLAIASSRGLSMQIDPHTYEAAVRERWPDLDATAIRRLSTLGHVFQALAGIAWACADLRFESALCLVRPVSSMRIYVAQIAVALEAEEAWLG